MEQNPEKRKPGRPKKVALVEQTTERNQMPDLERPTAFRIEGVYKMTNPDIAERSDGSAIMMSILPFLVMKMTKDKIAVRFPFGGTEVHKIVGPRVVLGGKEYNMAADFAEYAPGLFQ